ncbi:MAG: PD-(D/E)XK nuclease family protein [bacterium]
MSDIEAFSYKHNLIEHIGNILIEQAKVNNDLSRYAVVFPDKRPGLYLINYLSENLKSSFFPPSIFTITEFMNYINRSNTDEIELLDAVYELFKIIKSLDKHILRDQSKSLEDFIPWGIEVFRAIEELDTELVEQNRLTAIDLPGMPDEARRLSGNMSLIREAFHNTLKDKHLTTRGLIYRDACQTIKDRGLDEFKHIYFVGLIILTKAESEVIKHILKHNNASFFTQIESVNDPVVNNLRQSLDTDLSVNGTLNEPEPDITLYEASSTHEEVEYVYDVLQSNGLNPSKTAIVLLDPSALLPVLSNVMDYMPYDYNVTMGYPLERTPFYTLIKNIFDAQITKKHRHTYYTKDYLKLLKHPYIKGMYDQSVHTIVQQLEKWFIDNGKVFIELNDLEDNSSNKKLYELLDSSFKRIEKPIDINVVNTYIKTLHGLFFRPFEPERLSVKDFTDALNNVIMAIIKDSYAPQYKFSPSFIKGLMDTIEALARAEFREELFNKQNLFQLFDGYAKRQTIPFNGIPLKGLQILGLLETRVLNFNTVFILDCNEGILPSASRYEPLIPFKIKKALNLPTYIEHEQVFRYHFRRLIKSAQKVHLIYKKTEDTERSRFIEEIIWDEEKKVRMLVDDVEVNTPLPNSRIAFVKRQFRTDIKEFKKSDIAKNQNIMDKIKHIASDGLSPTIIDNYMLCPARFYYEYILELKETEELEEEVESKDIGSFVHKVLELFYKPYLNRSYEYKSPDNDRLNRLIEDEFNKTFYSKDNGELFLLKEMVKRLLWQFILKDGSERPEIISIETYLKTDFILINESHVHLKGKIDRVDKRGDEYLIIDYKTGSKANIPKISKILNEGQALKSREDMKELIGSFQLPVYIYLYHRKADTDGIGFEELNASLCMLKHRNGYYKTLFGPRFLNSRKEIMESIFIPSLKNLISEMLDPNKPFVHDDTDEAYCKACPFSAMCK